MRGTPAEPCHHAVERGIIPAYAGNTSHICGARHCHWDHPRVCGEHSTARPRRPPRPGSSPRMRGTPGPDRQGRLAAGIIPAYAGNTMTPLDTVSHRWDHPRVCGEHLFMSANCIVCWGSSPRMRGTPRTVRRSSTFQGIIPAYAGNTPTARYKV